MLKEKKLLQLSVAVCKYVFRHMSECRSSYCLNFSLSSFFSFSLLVKITQLCRLFVNAWTV